MNLHIIEQVSEADVEIVLHLVQRVRNLTADVLD